MKHIEIQKTNSAYILRFSRKMRTMSFILAGYLFLMGITFLISAIIVCTITGVSSTIEMILIPIVTVIVSIGLPWLILGWVTGFRLVADAQGVHRYAFSRVQRTFLWRHIRSCGIEEIPPSLNEGRVILPSFYVSTEKEIENMKNCLFIRVDKEDEQAIRASGLLSFCRTQMENADRTFQ